MRTRCLYALAVAQLTSRATAQSVSIAPSTVAPDGASEYVDPSYAGFGIEPSNLYSFTGGNQVNKLSVNLLQNLADYSGSPPHIRLGGNTQDYMLFDNTYQDLAWKSNPSSQAQGTIAADSIIIGPGYFRALDRFPKDTPVTFGLNMAYMSTGWEDNIVALAQGAVSGLKNVKLYSFEVGNEPDLWLQNNFRSAPWNGKIYTDQFLDRCQVVYERVLKPANLPSTFFETPATASTIGTTFEIPQLVNDGILVGRNGNNFINTWNQHDYYYFIGVTPTPLTLGDLMKLDTTNTQFAYWEKQVNLALNTGLPYALREMASVGPIGMPGVSDTHGAALWTLNFFLYASTVGISSVQMHMTENSNASAWQPIPMYGSETTFIRPTYYAFAAVAQLVGNGNGTTQFSQLKASVGGAYDGRVRAYASYAKGTLQAVVLINSKQANVGQSRGSLTFNVNFGQANAGKDIFLSYLTANGADSQKGTTWNGLKYDDLTGQPSLVDSTVKLVTADDQGRASIPVADSEAIIANIGWQLGSVAVLKPDGTQGKKKKNAASPALSSPSNAIFTSVVVVLTVLAMTLGA